MRVVAIIAIAVATLSVVAGAGAYAAYRYEQMRADRILPGVRIDGVDVSGMTRGEAQRAVRLLTRRTLGRELTVSVGAASWTTSAAELGQRAAVGDAVDRALALSAELGTFDRFVHRFRDDPLDVDIDLAYSEALPGIAPLVKEMAASVALAPRDARIAMTEDASDVRFIAAKDGARLASLHASNAIAQALVEGQERLRLRVRPVPAAVTARSLGPTVVVRVDRNELELYDGFVLQQTWDVATAKPGWTTPVGVWTIWDERENPTWYNPALDSWGANLPAVVPGGPGNPMGTRAIYIDAPGLIRIHGTTDPSSIGRYASHGCIRMHNEEIEDLFERIPVGAHVVVVGRRPAAASYWDTPVHADI
ncbi:MAG: L,D-transpeptidase family protein [Actinomycetota bacterium]